MTEIHEICHFSVCLECNQGYSRVFDCDCQIYKCDNNPTQSSTLPSAAPIAHKPAPAPSLPTGAPTRTQTEPPKVKFNFKTKQ